MEDKDILKIIKIAVEIEKHNAKVEERSIVLDMVEEIVKKLMEIIDEQRNLFNWRERAWRENA